MLKLAGLLAAALLASTQPVQAQEMDAYRLVVTYDRPGLATPHWQVTIPSHGLTTYEGKPEKGLDPGELMFRLSPAGRAKLGSLMDRSKGMQPCETRTKNLANMGQKGVVYTPQGAPEARCSFNYTDNKPLGEALDYVLAMVTTLQAGVELDRLHRYDRLGLDAVMVRLTEDAKTGRAAELGAIQPTLESLVRDEAVLERVRSRAQHLLELARLQAAPATQAAASGA